MKQAILQAAFNEISQDTKFIRLATITTFIHSIFFLLYIIYRASHVLTKAQGSDENVFVDFFVGIAEYATSLPLGLILLIAIPLVIGYSVLPPIGEGAMIYYLNNPRKKGTASLGKGMTKFLQMFEFDAAISFFNIVIFLAAISRIYVMDIGSNGLVITLMTIWFCIILLAEFLLPYTRYFIALEHMRFFEAMRKSMQTSIEHFNITFRFIVVDVILHLRFIINIVLVFGIPLVLMYLGTWIGIANIGLVQVIFLLIIIVLFLVTAYINGIIEAFFTTYRYKVYKHIKEEEAADEEAIAQGDLSTTLANVEEEKATHVPQQVIINQYVVQPGTTPHGQHPYQTGSSQPHHYQSSTQEIIVNHTEKTVSETEVSQDHIPLPPEAQTYISAPEEDYSTSANQDIGGGDEDEGETGLNDQSNSPKGTKNI